MQSRSPAAAVLRALHQHVNAYVDPATAETIARAALDWHDIELNHRIMITREAWPSAKPNTERHATEALLCAAAEKRVILIEFPRAVYTFKEWPFGTGPRDLALDEDDPRWHLAELTMSARGRKA